MNTTELKNILDSGATGDELMEKFGTFLARNPADLRKWLPPLDAEPFMPHCFSATNRQGERMLYITYHNHQELYAIYNYLLAHKREARHRYDGVISPFGNMDMYCLLYRYSIDLFITEPLISWCVPKEVLHASHYRSGSYRDSYEGLYADIERSAFSKPFKWFTNAEFEEEVFYTGLRVVMREMNGLYKIFLESDVPLTPSQEEAFVMMKLKWS